MGNRNGALAVLVAAALLVSSSTIAHADSGSEPTTGPLSGDMATALHYEQLAADHLQQGHMVEIEFGSAARTPGDVVGTGGWGDSGLWTGVYLGGQAMRYRLARTKVAQESDQADKAYWAHQASLALSRINSILAAEHIDINIAENWTGELKIPPHVNTEDPTGRHLADWGGGVVKGEKGMIQRACTPVGLGGLGIPNPNDNRVFQIEWKNGDGKTYNCETSPSRDTYAGLTFGLLTTFDLVGPDFPAMRTQIRKDLLSMGNFLFKYGWTYPRPHGYVSADHDFDGFFSPLFVYTPEARLNLTNAVRHVLKTGGSALEKAKWEAIWLEEFASQGPALGPSLELNALQKHDGYYKWNLSHLIAFNLLRTTSGNERKVLAQGFAAMDATTRNDINAHFEAITYNITGEPARRDAAVTHLREWLDYRANLEAGPVSNSPRCGNDIECVADDQYAITLPWGRFAWFPGTAGNRAVNPLPVAQRPPTDFVWQRPPTQLDGSQGATHRTPGIDFLTPYWMLRYSTETAVPKLRPLPDWPLPPSE